MLLPTCCWLALIWGKSLCPSVTGLLLVIPLSNLYMCSGAVNWGLDPYNIYGGGQLIWTSNLERGIGSRSHRELECSQASTKWDHLGKLKGEKGTCCSYCWEILLKSAFLRGGNPPFPCLAVRAEVSWESTIKKLSLFSKTKPYTEPRSCRAYNSKYLQNLVHLSYLKQFSWDINLFKGRAWEQHEILISLVFLPCPMWLPVPPICLPAASSIVFWMCCYLRRCSSEARWSRRTSVCEPSIPRRNRDWQPDTK